MKELVTDVRMILKCVLSNGTVLIGSVFIRKTKQMMMFLEINLCLFYLTKRTNKLYGRAQMAVFFNVKAGAIYCHV
jgi:hypothetical protein